MGLDKQGDSSLRKECDRVKGRLFMEKPYEEMMTGEETKKDGRTKAAADLGFADLRYGFRDYP